MGLNKPITVSGGLTAADVQSIIDAQTTAISGKVDAQTNTLKTDIPSSISGGASVSEIKAALDEKLPQYAIGEVVKSKQNVYAPAIASSSLLDYVVTIGKNKGYDFSKNGVTLKVPKDFNTDLIKRCVSEAAGAIVLTPVNKSTSLIISSNKTFYDNRDYDSGQIDRMAVISEKSDNGTYKFYDLSTLDESIMCLEFN